MFEMWKLNWKLWMFNRSIIRQQKKLVAENAPQGAFEIIYDRQFYGVKSIQQEIDVISGSRLYREARALDMEVPSINDKEMWTPLTENGRYWLTPKGRAHVRRLIDQEKARRFEVKTQWVTKLILPLLGFVIGLVGAITGLVAVLQHKK